MTKCLVLAGWFGLIAAMAGCGTSGTTPPFLSNTTVAGKGVPNGRSDSQAPFATLRVVASSADFGIDPTHAIKVGNGNPRQGDLRERLYLNALRGPNGEALSYERVGACCQFTTANGTQGAGLLDVFRMSGLPGGKSVLLYVNMYDPGPLDLPQGFTARTSR